jgi:hypothetical protein
MIFHVSKQRLYASLLILGSCILLFRAIRMLSEGALDVLVLWVSVLLIAELLIDAGCLLSSVTWWITNDKSKARIPLRIGATAAILHAVRVLIFVLGLIDGFAAHNNQAYANAYLYMGVTSIIVVSGGRRGDLFFHGDPGPTIYPLSDVGSEKSDAKDLSNKIEQKAAEGIKILLLMYKLPPQQLKLAAEKAHSLGMGTIGELVYSSYATGIDAGIDVFVHATRY